ncbi:IS1595 family transposase [Spiroplasma ixodetis]|nr:IS1595 family transposase [Spiroplasma ixodetis]
MIKRQSHWKIFPFIINNGAIPLTETGYKPINSKISDFGQYELILTGNNPVVCIWKNSTKIYQKNKGKINEETHKVNGQDEFYTKQYKIDDYWNAYLIDDTSGVDFSNLPNNQTNFSPHVLVEETMKLNEFNNTFQTEKQCLAYIASLKQIKCSRCSSFNLNTSNLRRMRCLKCHQTFSILTGTIFSKSQTPLISWFYLIFRWINTKHGIPSTDVAKELGVTLKTAWRMGHKIRSAIAKQKPQFIVEGIVQMDEMYLSHMGFKKQGRSLLNKTLIVGIYEKTTNNLIVKVLKNANSKNLLQFAINHISSKCVVHTDFWKGYRDLKSVFTKHETVNHQDGYVSKTGVNTNQIESVWKHIRRTFKTHIKVAKHHIHLYAKEAAYKFNNIPSFETVMLCFI